MSDTTTIRVSRELYNTVKTIARQQNENIQDVIEHAVKDYKKKKFFREMDEAYSRLRADRQAWAEENEEREAWDAALLDGQENGYEGK